MIHVSAEKMITSLVRTVQSQYTHSHKCVYRLYNIFSGLIPKATQQINNKM